MAETQDLRTDAEKFVKTALTEIVGQKPSKKVLASTTERIVKAFEAVTSARNISSHRSESPDKKSSSR